MARWGSGTVLVGSLVAAALWPSVVCAQFGGSPGPRATSNTDTRRDFYFTGKVIMEDGTPPPELVAVDLVCGSNRSQQTFTDSKGRFSFRLGDRQGVIPDVSSGTGDQDIFGRSRGSSQRLSAPMSRTPISGTNTGLLGCELHASLAGYRADDVSLSQHRSLDNPDVGTMILHRLAGVTGTAISVNSLAAPKDAKREYDKGGQAIRTHHWDKAQEHFAKAVGLYPSYAAAWYYLGVTCLQQKQTERAEAAFVRAVEADGSFVLPYLALAQLALQQKRWPVVVEYTHKLVTLDATDLPQAYLMQAMAQGGMRDFNAAEQSVREAIRLDKGHRYPRAEYVLGFILARKHDYEGAVKHMQAYVQQAPAASDIDTVRREIAQLEKAGSPTAQAERSFEAEPRPR